MWFVVENLRAYLGKFACMSPHSHDSLISYLKGSPEITSAAASGRGLYIGRRFFPPGQPVFNSGGAGAILDPAALKVRPLLPYRSHVLICTASLF